MTPRDLEVLDHAVLRELEAVVGAAAMRGAVSAACGHLSASVVEAEALAARDDLVQLGRLAHRLKGGAGSLGASSLAAAATRLEQAVLGADRPAVAVALESMARITDSTTHALRQLYPTG